MASKKRAADAQEAPDALAAEQTRSAPEQASAVPPAASSPAALPAFDSMNVDELLKRLDIVKREVQELKTKVAAANKKKEAAFRKKQEVGKQIAEKIGEITGSRSERNAITGEVRELKRQRDTLNQQIREKVAEIKTLTAANQDVMDRFDRKNNPMALQKMIEALEFKLETQPMGFEAEQKLTKKIKDLKKQFNEVKGKAAVFEQLRERSKEIDALKREANKYHRQVQEHAQSSQSKHEALLTESKEIDDYKKQEEGRYQEFLVLKKVYVDLNQQLKDRVAELQAIKDVLNKQNVKIKEEQKEEELKTLKERAQEAEEKVKNRKKLTTEDILALQGLKR